MRLVRIWTLFALCLVLAIGCKEDPMVRARAAHATERPDEAEKALKEVLAKDPKDFEARRLMADVHRFRGDFDKTEEALNALWKEKGFGDESKQLPPEERAQRDLLENQFNELYAKWSSAIDPDKDPDKFEKVVRAGLEWNKKSPTLNTMLVDHFLKRAEALEKEGKKIEAADAYEAVLGVRAMPAQRKDAQAKADALRKAAFADQVHEKFEALKAELETAKQYDAETKTITVNVEADVNKRLKQRSDSDLAKARKEATPAIRAAIAQWVAKLTGVPDGIAAVTVVKMGSGDEKLGRGHYSVAISMTLDDVIEGAFAAKQKAERAAAKADQAAPDDDGEAADAPNGTTGGAAPSSTHGKE